MKITAITPAQAARFGEWTKKWIEIGLSTAPADFGKATEAALKAYAICNLGRPMIILRMGSPYGATVGGAMACLLLREASCIRGKPSKVWQHVDQHVDQQVWQQVWQQVGQQVWQQVGQQVGQQVWHQVRQQVGQQVFGAAKEGFNNYRGGAFWASWCGYITYMRDVLGWQNPTLEKFSIEEDLAKSCGWVWWHQNVLAISDRPSAINRDTEGRLHHESGPSIAYRDGWKLHHIHGVCVPAFVVERPETITVKHIESEANAEVRRVMVGRMGMEKFVQESGLKPIHSDDFGTLYRKDLANDEPVVVVKVRNSTPEPDGSVKNYFLRVPPSMKRAREAVAWTFAMKEEEYLPSVQT
jgi:hypothetical protein